MLYLWDQQWARAGDNHTLMTSGGLYLVADVGDVTFGDALLLEVNRKQPCRDF